LRAEIEIGRREGERTKKKGQELSFLPLAPKELQGS
jgi:hypothetical protein